MRYDLKGRVGLTLAIAVLVCGASAIHAQSPSLKVAIVDLEQVFLRSSLGQQLQGELDRFQQQVVAEGERMTAEANDLRGRLAQEGASLPEDQQAELRAQFEEKAQAIRRFREDKQREAEKVRSDGLRTLHSKLDPIFESLRNERGYDLMLNNVGGLVIMARNDLDITEEVIRRLDASVAEGSGG